MKKFLSLVLIACMMLTAAALAEEAFVVQDKLPPALVTTVNANNESVEAIIYNAQGDVIAEITEGAVVLTDVYYRTQIEDETAQNRLTSAYEGVMSDVYHGDVECALHEHAVKVDIYAVLASLDSDLDAHDLVMYELFDVHFGETVEEMLNNGAYAQVTLQLADHQPLPLVVMFSGDGDNWTVIPYTSNGDLQITVNLHGSGAIALLCDGRAVMGIGEEPETVVIPGEGTTDEETSDNFTPSVSGKPAPTIEIITGTDGEEYVGVIGNNNDDTTVQVPNRNYVIVTAPAGRTYNFDIQTHEHLDWAYMGILEAENVGALPSDSHEGNIEADLNERLQEMGLDLTCEQLVVKDLFEVSAYGEYLHYLYDENYYLEITLETDLDSSKPVVVIHSPDSVHWHLHPIGESEVHEDGRITLRLYDLGTIALLVEADDVLMNVENAVQSPN